MRPPAWRGSLLTLVIFACAVASCAERGAAPDPVAESDETRATMNEIFGALVSVLPPSLSEARFSDPARRDEIAASLALLARNADRLERHGRDEAASFGHLSRVLARDAREVHERFASGEVDEARFLLRQMTETCVACHSRLPAPASTLGARLSEDPAVERLPLAEQARLQVATRQFDAALESYETLFLADDAPLASLDLDGHLTDYLLVAMRVEQDFERPRRLFEKLLAREELPLYLEEDLERWVRALRELGDSEGDSLARARALVSEGRAIAEFPYDRPALVHYLAASGVLHRIVADPEKLSQAELAEAYYLLGVTEAHTNPLYWLSPAEFYLETAIRLAPETRFARRAYALLEEQVLQGYAGSSGIHLPEDEAERLAELRALLDDANR